jgi:hypothetical protein
MCHNGHAILIEHGCITDSVRVLPRSSIVDLQLCFDPSGEACDVDHEETHNSISPDCKRKRRWPMVSVSVTVDRIEVRIEAVLRNPRGLNAALASRLVDELQAHFIKKNAIPSKMAGAKKTDFWKSIAQATQVLSVSDTDAVVTVAEARFRIHYYGGTIQPKQKKFLTIPLIPAARGLFARSYESATGKKLFFRWGKLWEKTDTGIRAVYKLAKKANIKKDPDALPSTEAIEAALVEEAQDYIKRETKRLT